MEFNIKKCKVMHLWHNNTEQAYFMEGQQLEVTEMERDIGVNVVKGLKQASQCQKAPERPRGSCLRYQELSIIGTGMSSSVCTNNM